MDLLGSKGHQQLSENESDKILDTEKQQLVSVQGQNTSELEIDKTKNMVLNSADHGANFTLNKLNFLRDERKYPGQLDDTNTYRYGEMG